MSKIYLQPDGESWRIHNLPYQADVHGYSREVTEENFGELLKKYQSFYAPTPPGTIGVGDILIARHGYTNETFQEAIASYKNHMSHWRCRVRG